MLGIVAGLPGKLKTVITNLTTLLARVSANVDVNVSTRAAASTALSNATWTDAKAGFVDMAISGVARIKSIQHINQSFTCSAGNAVLDTFTATITAVNTAKAFVIFNGASGPAQASGQVGRCWLSSSTQVSYAVYRWSDQSTTGNFCATVVEFY